MASTPLNVADTVAPSGATQVATINPGDKITSGVQYYNLDGTTYKNSQYQAPTYNPLPGAINNTPPPQGTTTSADSSYNAVNNQGNTINNLSNNPPGGSFNPTFDPNTDPTTLDNIATGNKIYTDRQAALQAQRDAEIAALTQEYSSGKSKLGETQANETGSTNRNLLYLQQGGQSASAATYLNKLELSHQQEMDTFTAKYNAAVQAAKNAYNDKDFQLAETEAKNASEIKKQAADRNQQFLDNSLKIRTETNNEMKFQYQVRTDARDFATKNGINQPFYSLDGQTLINATTGDIIGNEDAYKAAGGKGDYSDVQLVQPGKTYGPGIIGEYQYYVESMQKEGVKPLDFNAYQTMDANRKAVRSTTNIYNSGPDSQKEIDLVKKIIDSHPAEWGQAANAIDAKFGPGTATRYDALLKANYKLPSDARDAAKTMPANTTLTQWNTARQLFIQQNTYVDPDTSAAVWDKTVPKPAGKSGADAQASIDKAMSEIK